MEKISMFATANPTDKWAVCVDGMYGLYDDEAEALTVYNTTGGYDGDDGAAGTPFGSAQFLPPHYVPINRLTGEPMVKTRLSITGAIDIKEYIKQEWQEGK